MNGRHSAEDAARPEDAASFRVFAVLFALATVLYHRWSWFAVAIETLPLIAAFAVLVKPSSTGRFLALAVLQTIFAYRDLPGANTNRTLMVFVTATIVFAWLLEFLRAKRAPSAGEWLARFAPALRWQMLIAYFWACWHKLNVDFFDVQKSCGTELYLRVVERVPFLPLPTDSGVMFVVIVATVAVEGLLPILLLVPKTRLIGIAASAALHFGCGLTMFYDFSMTMLALLFLFTPPEFARSLVDSPRLSLRDRLGISKRQWSWIVPLTALAFVVITRVVFWDMYDFFALSWWLLVPILIGVFWSLARRRWTWPSVRSCLRVNAALAVIPVAVWINGASPFLGWKTETSFAMYSNLRTEGGRTNHLFVSRPLDVFDYQTDLVWVETSSDSELTGIAALGYPVPFYELRKRVWELTREGVRDIAITFRRAGRRVVVTAAELDPELSDAPNLFERKCLRFRTILPMDANVCSH